MMYANNDCEDLVEAFSGGQAKCPSCGAEVIAKCGEILIHHWSHKICDDCDSFSEPESLWHRAMKMLFPKEQREVVVGGHRADVKTPQGVLEFQRSSISPEEIREREMFWGDMAWVIDASEWHQKNLVFHKHDWGYGFRWKYPRKSWWEAEKDIYFYVNENWLFHVHKVYHDVPCGGSGRFVSFESFIQKMNGLPLSDPFDF